MNRSLPEPPHQGALLLRTDFTDDDAWKELCEAACAPSTPDGFCADLECISDRSLQGLTVHELVEIVTGGPSYLFVFLADSTTFSHAERPILAVDLNREPGRTVRVLPAVIWSVENNLSLANMDFRDFVNAADSAPAGIYRGF